jgi:predicted ATP-dependent endonuclease of OLD family
MRIDFVEIQNFRKLESVRIDIAKQTTLFVGANNSGKTSAMVAMRQFLVDRAKFGTNDFTLSNWTAINKIGMDWLAEAGKAETKPVDLAPWIDFLPAMDVWLNVRSNEVHRVRHLLPTLNWTEGLLGVRLRFEPKDLGALYKDFVAAAAMVRDAMEAAKKGSGKEYKVKLWPASLREFLDKRLKSHFEVRAYLLDASKLVAPDHGIAKPQNVESGNEPLEGDPFKGLVKINLINAQRGFNDASETENLEEEANESGGKHRLSSQLRSYYLRHLDPSQTPESSDLEALEAIEAAQVLFDQRLLVGFEPSLSEVETMNYPGITDPKIAIATRIRPVDGLNHDTAIQYEVIKADEKLGRTALRLPEDHNGLGYQNLISMVFRLMSFRDGWMKVGKAGKRAAPDGEALDMPPLHFVLIEEPEAHLHAQVQQVFIKRAYQILRKHPELGDKDELCTQLVISTHSSHVAHESEFASLRYFRRLPAPSADKVPISTVINMSEVFGVDGDTEKFVIRYLKATHCDLFFADAAILVEGPAERMLVPHFIRANYERISQAYITVLEIGGSHAHRFQPLVDSLGLITLVITDLDAGEAAGSHAATQPERGKAQVTNNHTLKTWIPKSASIDDLLDLPPARKVKEHDHFYGVRVAYQTPSNLSLVDGAQAVEVLANTFEDALLYENLTLFRGLAGTGMIARFREALAENLDAKALGAAFFKILRSGNKAEFALELLFSQDPKKLTVPKYIRDGLEWLQSEIRRKEIETAEQTSVGVKAAPKA